MKLPREICLGSGAGELSLCRVPSLLRSRTRFREKVNPLSFVVPVCEITEQRPDIASSRWSETETEFWSDLEWRASSQLE